MMTVEKIAKVVSEINRALASSGLQGVEGTNQLKSNLCVCVCVRTCICKNTQLDANRDILQELQLSDKIELTWYIKVTCDFNG